MHAFVVGGQARPGLLLRMWQVHGALRPGGPGPVFRARSERRLHVAVKLERYPCEAAGRWAGVAGEPSWGDRPGCAPGWRRWAHVPR